jgi:hypothetical protein
MGLVELNEKEKIFELLRRDPSLYAYAIGDLDEFYWPYTKWYALDEALALLYSGTKPMVLVVLEKEDQRAAARLLSDLVDRLPEKFYCNLSPRAFGAPSGPLQADISRHASPHEARGLSIH